MPIGLLTPSTLRFALQTTDEQTRESVTSLGRLLAAFYLDYPLFVPRPGTAYPSLFLWSQLSSETCPSGSLPLNREELGKELPAEYDPRTPAVLLTYCGLVLEAILYCDHFSDMRSSLLLRIFADKEYGLSLCDAFYLDLWTVEMGKQIELLADDQVAPEQSTAFCHRYIQSVLEMDVFNDSEWLVHLQTYLISQMELQFAQLPLKVLDLSLLPRPPIYCVPNRRGDSLEERVFIRMHLCLQMLLISLQKTNRLSIELNRAHSALSDEQLTAREQSRSLLTQALVLVLRTIYRDHFSLSVAENRSDMPTTAAKYNALIAETSEAKDQLRSWSALSSEKDYEHVTSFLNFVSERFPEKNDLPPLTSLSRPVWREAMFHEKTAQARKPDWLSTVLKPLHKVPLATFEQMSFIASVWTTPLALDSSLIPVLLHLQPSEICTPTNSLPSRPCVSARSSSQRQTQENADRIFSPRVDVVALYAEKGRQLLKKGDTRTLVLNEKKIRELQRKLKKNAEIQKELEDDINEEKSFLDSLPSSSFRGRIDRRQSLNTIETIPRLPSVYSSLKDVTEVIDKELRLLNTKFAKIKQPPLNHMHDAEEAWPVNHLESTFKTSGEDKALRDDAELTPPSSDRATLNYDHIAAANEPMPEIAKLDLSLLSPRVDVGRRAISAKPRPKENPHRALVLPEWMRLIPLGETNSSRLPLLKYKPPAQREWKTERYTQTQGVKNEMAETGCQTQEEEHNPMDSGFLDAVEKTPRKKIEIIQPMSKQNIREMLSQM